MGNNPSSAEKTQGASGHQQQQHHHHHQHHSSVGGNASAESPRSGKKEPKEPRNLIAQRSTASSPEATTFTAQGSTIGPKSGSSRPLSILNSTSSSPASASQHSSVSKSSVPKQQAQPLPQPFEGNDEPSKPVTVPATAHDPTPLYASQYDDPTLTPGLGSSSVQDLTYHISRPPRLPLPIEQEVHTPGSPIVAPADAPGPVEDVEGLDKEDLDKEEQTDELPRRASGLSNATDEDDAEELRVDKTRPTVPTKIEWSEGGQKVYVTGTPFQWSRKQRLVPS
jgi:hypothetical protein